MKKREEICSIRNRILAGGKVQLSEKEVRILHRFHTKRCERSVAFVQLLHAARCMRKKEPVIDEAQKNQEAGYYLQSVNRSLEIDYAQSVRDANGIIHGSLVRHLPAEWHGSQVPGGCLYKDVVDAPVECAGVPYIKERRLREAAQDAYEEARKTSAAYHPDPMEGQEDSAVPQKGGVFTTPSWRDSVPQGSGRPGRAEHEARDPPQGADPSSKHPKSSELGSGGTKGAQRKGKTPATSTVTSGSVYPHSTPPTEAPIFQQPGQVKIKRARAKVGVPKWTGPVQPQQELPANEALGDDLTEPSRIQRAIFLFKGNVASGPPTPASGDVGLAKLKSHVNVELERDTSLRKKMKVPSAKDALKSSNPELGLARHAYEAFESDFLQVSDTMTAARESRKEVASYTAGLWWDAEVTSATLHNKAVPQSVILPSIHPDLPDLVVEAKEVAEARKTLLTDQVVYGADLRRHQEQLAVENSRLKDENSALQVELEDLRKQSRVHLLVQEDLSRAKAEKAELTEKMRVQSIDTCREVQAATDRTTSVLETFDSKVEERAAHRIMELEVTLNCHYQCLPVEEPYVPSIAVGVQHPPNTVIMHTRNHRDALRHIELGQLMLTHPNLVRGRDALGRAVDFTNRLEVSRVPVEEQDDYTPGELEDYTTFKPETLDGGSACPSFNDAQWVKQTLGESNYVRDSTTAELVNRLQDLKTEEPAAEEATVVVMPVPTVPLAEHSAVAAVMAGPSQVKQELKEESGDKMDVGNGDEDDGLLESPTQSDDEEHRPFSNSEDSGDEDELLTGEA